MLYIIRVHLYCLFLNLYIYGTYAEVKIGVQIIFCNNPKAILIQCLLKSLRPPLKFFVDRA